MSTSGKHSRTASSASSLVWSNATKSSNTTSSSRGGTIVSPNTVLGAAPKSLKASNRNANSCDIRTPEVHDRVWMEVERLKGQLAVLDMCLNCWEVRVEKRTL
ncbi:unnamed protein product [Cutaneotrichosporon oleaginosum]